MGYLVCNKCGEYYKLQKWESPEDLDLTCECGGKFEYKESIKLNQESEMDKIKWILIFAGVLLIIILLGCYFESKSSLDIVFITLGLIAVIMGFSIQGEKFNRTVTYFVAMFSVNLLQWLTVICAVFINQITLTTYVLIVLAIAPLMTIYLISQIRRSDLKYLGNSQKTNKDVILADKIKNILNNMGKIILIGGGLVIMLVCLGSYLFSKSLLELFGCSVGMMAIVYGYYRENKNLKWVTSHNAIYCDIKKVKVTVTYFLAMFCLLVFQWLILGYIVFIYPVLVSNEVILADVNSISLAFTFALIFTPFFFVQIHESHLIKINWQGIFIGEKKIF